MFKMWFIQEGLIGQYDFDRWPMGLDIQSPPGPHNFLGSAPVHRCLFLLPCPPCVSARALVELLVTAAAAAAATCSV